VKQSQKRQFWRTEGGDHLTHEERYKLALEISRKVSREIDENLICFSLYGSTSRGTDTHWSDLEMLMITREEVPRKSFLKGTVPITVNSITEAKLRLILEEPDLQWPFYAGLVKNLVVLAGDKSKPSYYSSIASSVPQEKLRKALKDNLSDLVFESCGRIFSCIARKRYDNIYCAVIETLLEMRTALCLLNCTHVNHDYFEGIRETFKFKRLPKRYPVLATRMWKGEDPFRIVGHSRELLNNYAELLYSERILEKKEV
jgi:kanamycin nucleotidyltransferase